MPDPALIEAVLIVAVLWVLVDRGPAFLRAADDLGIGLFRPWRGDPWPRGVQEDDDFRFDWRPARSMLAAVAYPGADIATKIDTALATVETVDLVDAGVALARPDRVKVHRAGR